MGGGSWIKSTAFPVFGFLRIREEPWVAGETWVRDCRGGFCGLGQGLAVEVSEDWEGASVTVRVLVSRQQGATCMARGHTHLQ